MRTRFGACVRRARLHARFGRPIPTNTTSPSASSRAATVAMISSGEKSVAVIDSGAELRSGPEPLQQPRLFRHVLEAILYAVDKLIEIVRQFGLVARDRFPADVEIVIAVVVPLSVRRMRAPRLDDDGVHDRRGNDGAVGIGPDDALVHQLLDDHYDPLR